MDFDEIAEMQGWTERTCLWVVREFISRSGLQDGLDAFAREKAAEESPEQEARLAREASER